MRLHFLQNIHFLTFEGTAATDHAVGEYLKLTTNSAMVHALLDDIFSKSA